MKQDYSSYAEGIPRTLDYEEITMHDVLARTARRYPRNTGLVFFDTRINFAEFNSLVNRVANALIDLGLNPGDKVALLLPNIPQVAVATYAVWRAGGVVVMNNPLYTDPELEHQLKDSGATLLICLDLLAPRMISMRPRTAVKEIMIAHIRDYLRFPKKQLFPLLARDKHRNIPPAAHVHEWADLAGRYPDTDPKISVGFQDTAALQYTGGTTGVSKGVILTHANFSKNTQQGLAWIPNMTPGKITMGSLPIFHAFGLFAMNMCTWGVFANVLIPRPEAEFLLKAIHKDKVNLFPAVPTMLVGILNHPKLAKYDLSSLEVCVSGAAPCPVDVIRRFEKITGAQIVEGFGISEASPATNLNPVGGINKPGSIGLPLADTHIRIVSMEDGQTEMPVDQPGELCISGPQVSTHGYYNMPGETAATFRDGWLYTGDIARVDEDGYTWIIDRKKDMIIAGGYNIYPRDIDEVLFEHPKIEEACTLGAPDAYRGETVKAFVVTMAGEQMTEKEVKDWCRSKLAAYKVPKIVEFVDALPKSAVGKILRKALRE